MCWVHVAVVISIWNTTQSIMRKRVYKVHSVMFSAKEKSAVSLLLYEIPLDRSFSLEIISRSSTILSLQIGQLGSVCIVADNCPIFFFQRCRISCECYILLPLWTYSSNKHVHWKIFSSSLLFFFSFLLLWILLLFSLHFHFFLLFSVKNMTKTRQKLAAAIKRLYLGEGNGSTYKASLRFVSLYYTSVTFASITRFLIQWFPSYFTYK